MSLKRIDHVGLTVRDLAASTAFYRDTLGMEVVRFGRGRTAVRFGHQTLTFHEAGRNDRRAAHPTPGAAELCFLTDEPLAHWIARLRVAGVAVEAGPVARRGALGTLESLDLRDPDGNLLEIGRQVDFDEDPLDPLRLWLGEWQECVRTRDYAGARSLCAADLVAVDDGDRLVGLDQVAEQLWPRRWGALAGFRIDLGTVRGGAEGDRGWVLAAWEAAEARPAARGWLTVVLERRQGRWLAVHTHGSRSGEP
jgi:catechol 2,3-dioxygenase-like lactoylglutathione lyase family enzyme/ketosteroid isomerase-like protein